MKKVRIVRRDGGEPEVHLSVGPRNKSGLRNLGEGFRAIAIAVAVVATFVFWPGSVELAAAQRSSKAPIATGARLGGGGERTRFVTDLSASVGFSVSVLADPFRVIIDLPEVNFQLPAGLGSKGHGLVSAYRYGLFASGKSRIVLDATEPVLIEKSFMLKPQNGQPARLVVDLVRTDRSTFLKIHNLTDQKEPQAKVAETPGDHASPAVAPQIKTLSAAPPRPKPNPRRSRRDTKLQTASLPKPKPKPKSKRRHRKPVIIIDPGHGGVDPGAVGRRGTAEKTVVLAFAKVLKKQLLKSGKYKVYMTRDNDRFIKLRDRVKYARKHNGDLFIAVHADSIGRRKSHVRGATVYTLSSKASDKEAAALATRENKADLIAGVDLASQNGDVTGILIDLAQRATNKFSSTFAKVVVKHLGRSTRLTRVPHRQAGFRVLKAPDIPSILLELGYISNRHDETLLRSEKWRRKVTSALASAVDTYFTSHAENGS